MQSGLESIVANFFTGIHQDKHFIFKIIIKAQKGNMKTLVMQILMDQHQLTLGSSGT